MDAPDELRQEVASAVDLCVDGWNGEPWDMALQVADAVLAVPGIADALARDAQVREIVAAHDGLVLDRAIGFGRLVAAMLRDDTPADDSDIMPGSEFDGPVADNAADALARDAKVAEIVAKWASGRNEPWPLTVALEVADAIAALYPEAGKVSGLSELVRAVTFAVDDVEQALLTDPMESLSMQDESDLRLSIDRLNRIVKGDIQ